MSTNAILSPSPMIGKNKPVDWVFIFKFNAHNFPGGELPAGQPGLFGGTHKEYHGRLSQQYVYASSKNPALQKGSGSCGATYDDPLGATFAQIYDSNNYYVLWNDQFYNNPIENGDSPWGHSKGALTWNEKGEGMVLQVSTPSWPGSGSSKHPRQNDGNTLGCIKDDDIEVSQHFFALKLTKEDVVTVLKVIRNASVRTDISKPSIVNNGGPAEIQAVVKTLGKKSKSTKSIVATLSSGIRLISKPSKLAVPPWQLVSSKIGSLSLRVASWWARPTIPSTNASSKVSCWSSSLGKPGAVDIATTGKWADQTLGLKGGMGTDYNHAKLGISADSKQPLSVFGDMNQQGALNAGEDYSKQKCNSSQNGRGGTFYVLENQTLWESMTKLLAGESAPLEGVS